MMGAEGQMGEEVNPFEEAAGMYADEGEDQEDMQAQEDQQDINPFDEYDESEDDETEKAMVENPLVKAFDEYLQKTIK